MPLPQKRKRRTPRMGVHRVPRRVLLTQEGHKTNNDIRRPPRCPREPWPEASGCCRDVVRTGLNGWTKKSDIELVEALHETDR